MTIPISTIVRVNPGVIGTGGTPLSLNAVVLDQSQTIPIGKVLSFDSVDAVQSYFGIGSTQEKNAQDYFLGYDNSTIKPGRIFFAPYAANARAAWVMSAAGLTLAAVKALSAGTLTLTINGTSHTTSSINLSSATSLSDAASTIQAALVSAGFTGVTCTYSSTLGRFIITSNTTGAASTITYASGTLSSGLLLTQAAGATLSPGSDADTPATAMANVVLNTHNWATVMTSFEPDTATKLLFSVWCNAQNQRFLYVAWDTDATAITQGASSSFGAQVLAAEYDGTVVVGADTTWCSEQGTTIAALAMSHAAVLCGMIASIDFSRTAARITTAFKTQSGLLTGVGNAQYASNLTANGYNYFGSYATDNDTFKFFYPGQMAGKWRWIDAYVNEIYMNAQFQLALITLLTTMGSVPYNQTGYALIRASLMDTIISMKNFGAIQPGISLSSTQVAAVNTSSGTEIDKVLTTEGWYLQILDPGAQVRGNRGTPVINFWYTDGGSVHSINMASIDVM